MQIIFVEGASAFWNVLQLLRATAVSSKGLITWASWPASSSYGLSSKSCVSLLACTNTDTPAAPPVYFPLAQTEYLNLIFFRSRLDQLVGEWQIGWWRDRVIVSWWFSCRARYVIACWLEAAWKGIFLIKKSQGRTCIDELNMFSWF